MLKEAFALGNREQLLNRLKKHISLFLGALLIFSLLTGCTSLGKTTKPMIDSPPRKLAVFFDGTANDESSDTNIHKLHELVRNQERKDDIGTFYIDGVGADLKIIGMGTGWGISYRVKHAYMYLAENYRKGDKIYLFGFSRGAYSARILASMLYHAGLPVNPVQDGKLRTDYATVIYDAFKGDMTREERKKAVRDVVDKTEGLPQLEPVDVTFLGLWDTVEALGVPDYEENVIRPNSRYGDQLCNVQKAAHALSLDDNRARIFTPILLTRPHLLEHCTIGKQNAPWSSSPEAVQARLDSIVDEVWFTGAHADVGGGYKDKDTGLSGVSLNWMIAKLINEDLLPAGTKVHADPDGDVHDPEAGLWGALYRQKWRSFVEYASNSPYNHGKLKIHDSVINRLKRPEKWLVCTPCPPEPLAWTPSPPEPLVCPSCRSRSSQWRLPELFPYCFPINDNGGYDFTQASGCQLEKVTTSSVN
jgi:uncharacterized protein (DUF2235 family)